MSITVGKSCKTCPSYLQPAQAVGRFKKSIGAPMCGRFGYVLGKPGAADAQEEKLARHYAENCVSHGDQPSPIPVRFDHFVTVPDMAAHSEAANLADVDRTNLQEVCRSCAQCRHYVPDNVVSDEIGWTVGLCSAKGKLVMPTKLTIEARNCDLRLFGQVKRTTTGLTILPEFEDAFNLNVDPVNSYFKSKLTFVDPVDYVTDKPVSDEDKATGIRAWRLIKDPAGTGFEVHLPIYDLAHFNDAEKVKIPRTGDDEHPELYIDHNGSVYKVAVLWTQLDETPALWGEAGTGKTELFRHLAWLMCLPFERISVTGEMELDDLAGKTLYSAEVGTYFQQGRLPLAWTKPCVICLDEPNVGQPEVWQFIRPLTDNSKQLVLDMNEGERLSRHPDCYLGMAMNPAWDPRNVGAAPIGDADARRLMHIFMDLPPEIIEREIITQRVSLDGWEIDAARLDSIMKIAADLRPLCADGTLPMTWGVAQQIKVARASRWFEMRVAYRMAAADFLEPQAQEAMMDQVKAHIE